MSQSNNQAVHIIQFRLTDINCPVFAIIAITYCSCISRNIDYCALKDSEVQRFTGIKTGLKENQFSRLCKFIVNATNQHQVVLDYCEFITDWIKVRYSDSYRTSILRGIFLMNNLHCISVSSCSAIRFRRHYANRFRIFGNRNYNLFSFGDNSAVQKFDLIGNKIQIIINALTKNCLIEVYCYAERCFVNDRKINFRYIFSCGIYMIRSINEVREDTLLYSFYVLCNLEVDLFSLSKREVHQIHMVIVEDPIFSSDNQDSL